MTDIQILARRRAVGIGLLGAALKGAVSIIKAAKARWQAAATRRAVRELTRDQLDDIGYQTPDRPTLEIRAGTMTNLMSMR